MLTIARAYEYDRSCLRKRSLVLTIARAYDRSCLRSLVLTIARAYDRSCLRSLVLTIARAYDRSCLRSLVLTIARAYGRSCLRETLESVSSCTRFSGFLAISSFSFNRLSSKLVGMLFEIVPMFVFKYFVPDCFVAQICANSGAHAHFGAYLRDEAIPNKIL